MVGAATRAVAVAGLAILLCAGLGLKPAAAHAVNVLTVVDDSSEALDGDPGDGDCDPNDDGNVSDCNLHAAIHEANFLVNDAGNDRIVFDAGVTSITPASLALHELIDPVDLGVTAGGACPNAPVVEIDGTNVGSPGLRVGAGGAGSKLCGMAIFNFATQVRLSGDGVTLTGNYIGLDASGAAGGSNVGPGLDVQSDNNLIGVPTGSGASNVIGDLTTGIQLSNIGTASGNVIEDNFIGTNKFGSAAIANTTGVSVISGAGANTIGGDGADEGNVISGNVIGVAAHTDTTVEGNLVGLDATGTAKLANSMTGIFVSGDDVVVGGADASTDATTAGPRNVVVAGSAGGATGIRVGDGSGHTIAGNFIGTDETGLVGLDPGGPGIAIRSGAGDPAPAEPNIVGGDSFAERNVIADSITAVQVLDAGTTNNRIQGNFIGADRTGTTALDNVAGISISAGADGNTIGGAGLGEGNVIGGSAPILLDGVSGTGVHGNLIGTDLTGLAALQGPGAGVRLLNASDNTIGSAAAPNTIAGRTAGGEGILIEGAGSTGNSVIGNRIGTDLTGNASLGVTAEGVRITSDAASNTIGGGGASEGNVIAGVGAAGVEISGGATSNSLFGNRIGVGADGSTLAVGAGGVLITGADNNDVGGTAAGEGNLISGAADGFAGVTIDGASTSGNRVRGNLIGTSATGTSAQAASSQDEGVLISGGANSNEIGGAGAGEGNLISGNDEEGVAVEGSNSTEILGNRIGTNAAGTSPVANGSHGVEIRDASGGTEIGAADTTTTRGDGGAGNLISGNGGNGIELTSSLIAPGATTVRGNHIGTTAAGTTALANGSHGVRVTAGTTSVGGSVTGGGNLISGNTANGVRVEAGSDPGQVVAGNRIGPHRDGESELAGSPFQNVGVEIRASGVTVGGEGAAAANTIARNGIEGVQVTDDGGPPSGVAILGNSIFSNGSGALDPGIDLNDLANTLDGPTPNDAGDADAGANGLQNFPLLTAAETNGSTTVEGSLNSSPDSPFRIEFFSSPTADPSGNGEGRTFLGSVEVGTDGSGDATISATGLDPTDSGAAITATATPAGGAQSTSEFSSPVTATAAPEPPTPPPALAPELGLSLAKSLRADRLKARVSCEQGPCEITLKGKASVESRGGKSAARSGFRLRPSRLSLADGEGSSAKLKLKSNRRSLRRIARLLRRGGKGTLKLRAIAANEAGKDVVKGRAKLKRPRR